MALYQGCIADMPGEERYANDSSLYGEVEHNVSSRYFTFETRSLSAVQLVLFGSTLFIVVELRYRDEERFNNCVAHLLLEFLCQCFSSSFRF